MAEALSARQTMSISNRLLQSPTGSFFLGSNDDELERAKARAASRAAAIRRCLTVVPASPSPSPSDPCLTKDQIIELFQNCIKLASENKINQKNTWELKLIDHLGEIINVEAADGDSQTNFQKASSTLEAGVKIYSSRVDALYAETYKVLDGVHRVGQDDDLESMVEVDNANDKEERSHRKKESDKKIYTISTLGSSFKALNITKFDFAFAVDPLYQQTSAQFDKGGAEGLLLNNLGVYEGCRVLFDSFEVPGKCKLGSLQNNDLDMIDISFAKEPVEKMASNMLVKNEICPTLKAIVCRFDDDNERSSEAFDAGQKCDIREDTANANEAELDDNSLGNYDAWIFDHDEVSTVVNEVSSFDPFFYDHHGENGTYASNKPNLEDRFEDVAKFLFQALGFTSRQHAWAGPNHWKYQNRKYQYSCSEDIPATNDESGFTTKRSKRDNLKEVDIDFTKSLDNEMPDVLVPPQNPKLLLLPVNRALYNNTLPEDFCYQPESLVKLFLLPNIMCLDKRSKCSANSSWQQNKDFDGLPSWDNEGLFSSQFDDEFVDDDDVRNFDDLVSQPRQVNKMEVQYDKTSKQFDVQALKDALWDHMQGSLEDAEVVDRDALSFKYMLATFPFNCQAATPKDLTPHLCFLCLLHLANEHGLSIQDCPTLDDLRIHIPASCPTNNLVYASS